MTSERRGCDRGLKLATEIRRGEIRLGGGIESVLASAGQVSESIDYSSNRVALSACAWTVDRAQPCDQVVQCGNQVQNTQ